MFLRLLSACVYVLYIYVIYNALMIDFTAREFQVFCCLDSSLSFVNTRKPHLCRFYLTTIILPNATMCRAVQPQKLATFRHEFISIIESENRHPHKTIYGIVQAWSRPIEPGT